MSQQIILAYNFEEYLDKIAKKGSETDIRYYNRKNDEKVTVFLDPFRFPEKITSLTNPASLADAALLKINTLSKELGEVILALDAFSITEGAVITTPELRDRLQKIFRNTVLEKYKFIENSLAEVLAYLDSIKYEQIDKKGYIVVDQFFTVHGTGTVALGFVKDGYIERHEPLRLYPGQKKTEIRSIQAQDLDIPRAEIGTRVGVALKNLDVEDLTKGSVLALDDAFQESNTISLKIKKNPAVPYLLEQGQKVQLHFAMSSIVSKITDISESHIILDLEKDIPLMPVHYAIIALDKFPRIYAGGTL
ncbi:MAG: EF-Tu/IF-2/RF-3 family GTPase [Thermoplasmata archaeon]